MKGRQWAYSLLSTAIVGLMAIGCSGDGGDDKPREPVSGTVTMDGQSLPEGAILFAPAGSGEEALASATGKIENGEFSIPRAEGPVPGTYKVMISHTDQKPVVENNLKITDTDTKTSGKTRGKASSKVAKPKELIPARYNSQSTLKEEIKKGGASGLKYELQSK